MGRRRGILGGTFDPPHRGHVIAAEEVGRLLDLDEVVLVVANDPWQKTAAGAVTPADQRLAMTRLAVADVPGVTVSDVELRRGGPSYMVDTLRELRRDGPDDELVLILGEDAAAGLDTWDRADELRGLAELVVVCRPGVDAVLPAGWELERVEIPAAEISSTEVREIAARGEDLSELVPEAVVSFIGEAGLYREGVA